MVLDKEYHVSFMSFIFFCSVDGIIPTVVLSMRTTVYVSMLSHVRAIYWDTLRLERRGLGWRGFLLVLGKVCRGDLNLAVA